MKGFVFTELTELAERKFGEDAMDNVFDNVELSSGGAYTSVGYYAAEELNTLVVELAKRQSICSQVLVHGLGEKLFKFVDDRRKSSGEPDSPLPAGNNTLSWSREA